jgi:hypothetical protein
VAGVIKKPVVAPDLIFAYTPVFEQENFAAGIHQQKNASGVPS